MPTMPVSPHLAKCFQWIKQTFGRTSSRSARKTAPPHLEALESRDLLAPGDFRMVTYNIASSGGAPRPGLETILRAIGDEVHNGRAQPLDLLALQETQSQATTTQAVANLLNGIYGPGAYTRGTLDGDTTGFGRPGVVYNTQALQLLSQLAIGTSNTMGQPRQAVRYLFHPVGFPSSADFYVYNSHYDAGGSDDRRLIEATAIRADTATLPPGAQIIYLGDYNVLTQSEDGYQHILSPGPGRAFDPLARPARWRDDEGSLDILTQTPAVSPPSPLFGGGLDDRFDQQLVTASFFDGTGLEYRYGSLHAFGNNGSVPLNGNVNDPSSTALPSLPNRSQLLDLLTTVSDHLPVVADYTLNAPSALVVRWLEPTETGFTLYFDRPINPSTLNLYSAPMLGAADLTVTGPGSGRVNGSLVVAPDARSITFIQTGGVLAQGTYTVTLRSAADGFRDASGGLLDGNGDGVPGDSLTTRFSVPPTETGTATVSIPDFARGPGQAVNVPAGGTGIPIRLNTNAAGVTSVRLTLWYNPLLLSVTAATMGSVPDSTVTLDVSAPGAAVVQFTSAAPFAPGERIIARLTATVPNTAPYTSKHVLDLTDIQMNGAVTTTRGDDGFHVAGYFGDATGNAGYSSADALRILRVAVGLDGGFAAYQLADPNLIADIDGNGRVNAADALRVQQEALGINRPEIPPLPGVIPPIVPGGPDPLLHFPKRVRGRPGRTVTVPLLLSPSDGLESADLSIAYDAGRLELVGVRRGNLTRDFDLFAIRQDDEAGTVRVGLGRSASSIRSRGTGSVLELVFRARLGAPPGSAVINLRHSQLNEGGLDLNPDPSDAAGDVLDGFVGIARRNRRRGA